MADNRNVCNSGFDRNLFQILNNQLQLQMVNVMRADDFC